MLLRERSAAKHFLDDVENRRPLISGNPRAIYRAGAGATQPGSLALAIGFSAILPALIYFNAPNAGIKPAQPEQGWRAFAADARLRAAALFLFPALIWILSAPLVTAVENAI